MMRNIYLHDSPDDFASLVEDAVVRPDAVHVLHSGGDVVVKS